MQLYMCIIYAKIVIQLYILCRQILILTDIVSFDKIKLTTCLLNVTLSDLKKVHAL